jgi:hypothetical protein
MRKQAGVKNVYEALTFEMLKIANEAAINPLKAAQPSQDYGIAGAHIEGEMNYAGVDKTASYALDVYWAGKVGYVAIVMSGQTGTDEANKQIDDDFQFSLRDDTKRVGKKAQDLLYKLRGKASEGRW